MRWIVGVDPHLPFPSTFHFLLDCGLMVGPLVAMLKKESTFSSYNKDSGQNDRKIPSAR